MTGVFKKEDMHTESEDSHLQAKEAWKRSLPRGPLRENQLLLISDF